MQDLELKGAKVESSLYNYGAPLPSRPAMISEVSGTGMLGVFWNPGSKSVINLIGATPSSVEFTHFSEIPPVLRFLVTCGPLPDLDVAKESLSDALYRVRGDIQQLRAPSVNFTALEWAAKKGNIDTVQWLCSDERTKAMVNIGSPIGWACYTGQVEVARMLLRHGANPGMTDVVLFNCLPPLMVAAQNGQLDAMKFLVEECKQDINMIDGAGRGVLKNISDSPNWRNIPGHVACHKWAKQKLHH